MWWNQPDTQTSTHTDNTNTSRSNLDLSVPQNHSCIFMHTQIGICCQWLMLTSTTDDFQSPQGTITWKDSTRVKRLKANNMTDVQLTHVLTRRLHFHAQQQNHISNESFSLIKNSHEIGFDEAEHKFMMLSRAKVQNFQCPPHVGYWCSKSICWVNYEKDGNSKAYITHRGSNRWHSTQWCDTESRLKAEWLIT